MNGIKNKIINVVRLQLNTNEEIDCNTPLSEYGIDSFRIIEIVMAIEEIYGFEFESEKLTYETMRTINSIAEYVAIRLER